MFGWPVASCSFPAWVTQYKWRDLSGVRTYMTNTEGSVLTVQHNMGGSTTRTRESFKCLSVHHEAKDEDKFIAMSFTSHDW